MVDIKPESHACKTSSLPPKWWPQTLFTFKIQILCWHLFIVINFEDFFHISITSALTTCNYGRNYTQQLWGCGRKLLNYEGPVPPFPTLSFWERMSTIYKPNLDVSSHGCSDEIDGCYATGSTTQLKQWRVWVRKTSQPQRTACRKEDALRSPRLCVWLYSVGWCRQTGHLLRAVTHRRSE